MTKLVSVASGGSLHANTSIWYLKVPSVTTADVVCNCTTSSSAVLGSLSLYNVNQPTTFRDTDSAGSTTGTSASLTLTTVVGDYCVAVLKAGYTALDAVDLVPGGSQAEEWDLAFTSASTNRGGASTLVASGVSTELSYTWTADSCNSYAVTAVMGAQSVSPVLKHYYDLLRE
jgi:hypothetical protein